MNNHTPFPKHHIQHLPVYLKYLQYPQKPGKCLPHFPFDCLAIRGQVLTYTHHERCLPFTLALDNLQLTGAYHRRSTYYGIRYQQCDSSSTTAIHPSSSCDVPYFQVFIRSTAAVIICSYNCSNMQMLVHILSNVLINAYLHL